MSRSQIQLLHDTARQLFKQGHYKEALDICLQVTRAHPEVSGIWFSAAVNCLHLARWQETIDYGQIALARGVNAFQLYDTLAQAHGELGQWDKARRYGLQALNMRARQFSGEPAIPLSNLPPMPPLPCAPTRERNIIAFSLFGDDLKYCESAILNVQERPQVYPHWVCRFYVDGSVPEHVIGRLRAGGAQIVLVEGPAVQWPGEMWRLLALNDPHAHRILFRDADAVISRREAAAVGQWLTSGKRFHMMRDWSSHTELIMAGLWGVVAGSLPPLERMMQRFMSAPLESRHFADQYFLRQYVWPYARTSLMQHDSVFGFMDAVPFPNEKAANEPNIGGYCESPASFTVKFKVGHVPPDGSEVTWVLYMLVKLTDGQTREGLVCSYPGIVKDDTVNVHIPARYAQWIQQGTAVIRLTGSSAA